VAKTRLVGDGSQGVPKGYQAIYEMYPRELDGSGCKPENFFTEGVGQEREGPKSYLNDVLIDSGSTENTMLWKVFVDLRLTTLRDSKFIDIEIADGTTVALVDYVVFYITIAGVTDPVKVWVIDSSKAFTILLGCARMKRMRIVEDHGKQEVTLRDPETGALHPIMRMKEKKVLVNPLGLEPASNVHESDESDDECEEDVENLLAHVAYGSDDEEQGNVNGS